MPLAPTTGWTGSTFRWDSTGGVSGDVGSNTASVGWQDPTQSDVPVFDVSTGKMKKRNGSLFSGNLNGYTYANGVLSGQQVPFSNKSINPNDANQRYQGVNIPKGSPVAGGSADLAQSFQSGQDQGLKDFGTYLSQAKGVAGTAIDASKAAGDVSQTTQALQGAQKRYDLNLADSNARYQQQLQQNAAAETGVVNQATQDLGLYDTALTNAEGLAQQQAENAVTRYGMGKNAGGANMGLGTDVARLALQKSYEASQPYELAKVNQRYSNLSNYALPVARDIGQQGIAYAGSYLPGISAASFSSTQGTAQAIQSLKQAAAAQDWSTVQQILQLPGGEAAVRNAIYGGDVQILSALNALYGQTNYQGLQDLMGTNVSQPVGFNNATPGFGSGPRYNVSGGTGTAMPSRSYSGQPAPAGAPASRYGYSSALMDPVTDQYGNLVSRSYAQGQDPGMDYGVGA